MSRSTFALNSFAIPLLGVFLVAGCSNAAILPVTSGPVSSGSVPFGPVLTGPVLSPAPAANACAASVPGNGHPRFPTDTASVPLVDGIYHRPDATPITVLGPNDGVANSYSLPFPGSLGGSWLEFYYGQHVTITGQGYFLVRWEYAYFNRGGVLTSSNEPLVTTTPGTYLKKVALTDKYMPDLNMDSQPGTSGMWRPGLQGNAPFLPITIAADATTSGWANEYYYLNGTVTFLERENGLDYNISLTPKTFQQVHDDVTGTTLLSASNRIRPMLSLDPFPNVTPPNSPVNLTATPVSDSEVHLNWEDCSQGQASYLVEYSYAGNFGDPGKTLPYAIGAEYTTGATLPAGSTSFALAKLQPSTPYYIRIKAYNQSGDSAYSNIAQVTTPASQPLAASWQQTDVIASNETMPTSGSSTEDGGSYVLRVASGDIWNASDSFHFIYQKLAGDGTITAHVVGLTYTSVSAKAGVMIRETLDSDSAHVLTNYQPGSGVGSEERPATGSSTFGGPGVPASFNMPYWIRLIRRGNVFTSQSSPDGQEWTKFATQTVPMNKNVYIGLVAASLSSTPITVTYDNVSVGP